MSDIKERIKAARLPERTVQLCLRGDLQAEFEDLERQLEEALRVPADALEGDASVPLAERIEALRQQMLDETVTFRLRAMTRSAWRAFVAEHPPRKDPETGDIDERDQVLLLNVETFYPDLIRRSVFDPELDDSEWALLLDEALTDRQFGVLADAAWGLNRRDIDIPFSSAASRMTRNSATE